MRWTGARFTVEYDTYYATPQWVVFDDFDDERVACRPTEAEALAVAARLNLKAATIGKGLRDIDRDVQGVQR